MSCLSWNCRGLGHPRSVDALHQLVKTHRPGLVFLIETKLRQNEFDRVKYRIGRPNGLIVDSRGRQGGIALLWPRELGVKILSYSSHHIEALIQEGGNYSWRFIGFYGHHEVGKRKHSWNLMRYLAGKNNRPTLFVGDFNEVLNQYEHKSSRRRPLHQVRAFQNAIGDSRLIDLRFNGYPFTWSSNFLSPFTVRARLDRAFGTQEWMAKFQGSEVVHLSTNKSDHLPLYIKFGCATDRPTKYSRRFRFEEQWHLFEGCKEVIQEVWGTEATSNSGTDLFLKIQKARLGLLKWKRDKIGHIPQQLAEKQEELDQMQRGTITNESKLKATILSKEIDIQREANFIYWRQRARSQKLAEGDRCTKYFHATATQRKKNSTVTSLQNERRDLETGQEKVHDIAINFYSTLFTSQSCSSKHYGGEFPRSLTSDLAQVVTLPYLETEIQKAMYEIPWDKSPGPDGMSGTFYHKNWATVGPDVTRMVLDFVNGDDSLLFGEATTCEATVLKSLLVQYERASGQRINQVAQRLQSHTQAQSSSPAVSKNDLQHLWNLRVQPQVKHFHWRFYQDTLPTTTNLQKRKMALEVQCKFCNFHLETTSHLFLQCPYIRDVCRHLGISPELHGVSDTREAVTIRRKGYSSEYFELWCLGLWDS